MEEEILALKQNNSWIVTDLSSTKVSIGWKGIYKVKYKFDGSIDQYEFQRDTLN